MTGVGLIIAAIFLGSSIEKLAKAIESHGKGGRTD